MTIRLAIRGFAAGVKQFEELVTLNEHQLEVLIPALAEKHAAELVAHKLHMIEIEFLDEPHQEERFFRFGTDPQGMVAPLEISLGPVKIEEL